MKKYIIRFYYMGKPNLLYIQSISNQIRLTKHKTNLRNTKSKIQTFDIDISYSLYKKLVNFNDSTLNISEAIINKKRIMILNFSSLTLLNFFSGTIIIINQNNLKASIFFSQIGKRIYMPKTLANLIYRLSILDNYDVSKIIFK